MEPQLMQLIDRFDAIYGPLRDKQSEVAEFVRGDEEYPLWAYQNASRDIVANHIEALEYLSDEDEAGVTRSMPAVLGVPYDMLADVQAINALRESLVDFLRKTDREYTPEGLPLSKYLLEKVGLERLNRKATARIFRVLEDKPESISYTWAQATAIKPLSKEQAISVAARRLKKPMSRYDQRIVQHEQDRLLQLPDETPLARVYLSTPQPRVNVIIKGKRRPLMTAHLPLFYPASAGEPLPIVVPLPDNNEARPRLKRADAKLEDEAFAPTLRIYRYKQ